MSDSTENTLYQLTLYFATSCKGDYVPASGLVVCIVLGVIKDFQ